MDQATRPEVGGLDTNRAEHTGDVRRWEIYVEMQSACEARKAKWTDKSKQCQHFLYIKWFTRMRSDLA